MCDEQGAHAAKRCCKKFVVFMVSGIGLCFLLVAYSIIGGVVFMELEWENEQRVSQTLTRQRFRHLQNISTHVKLFVQNISTNTCRTDTSAHCVDKHMDEIRLTIDEVLVAFRDDVYIATMGGWMAHLRQNETTEQTQWTFPGALLFSVTVITTIGYGNLCPKTWQGRLVTIIYALIGIPMTVMCLTNMGSTLASCFRFLYKKVILKLVRRRRHVESGLRIEVLKASLPPLVVSSDSGDCELAKEENTELSPGEKSTKQVVLKQIYEDDSDKLVRVPLPVTVFILTSYVCVGAFMFTLWEKDWDFLTSAYCCFITLSTIGFGDFVPGMNSLDGEAKRVIAILYLFFGLMTLAMCFELVQQEVRDRFRDIGLWLGVVERKKSKSGSVREKQKNVQ